MFAACVNMEFKSDIKMTRGVIDTAIKSVRENVASISEDDLFELSVIFNELINNAIIHGNKYDKEKKVILTVKTDNDMIFSSVADEGEGFEYTKWFIGKSHYDKVFAEHGRGLLIVSALTDSMAFNENGNTVEFYKFLTKQAIQAEANNVGEYIIA